MKNIIHKTSEELLADNSQNTNSNLISHGQKLDQVNSNLEALHQTSKDKSIETTGFTGVIQELQGTERKLEEIKSANLIANQNLKGIKQAIQEDHTLISLNTGDAAVVTVKGKDGKDGVKGPKGDKGDKGETGKDGKDGTNGRDGKNGFNGVNGRDGQNGLDGQDGKDGQDAVLEPDEIVNRVNASTKRINPKQVEGLREAMRAVDSYGKNPSGKMAAGGSQPIVWLSAGTRLSDFVTEVNISTNITAVYSGNGRITLTASAGGGFTALSATETPNGSITVFTFSAASAQPSYLVIDNVWMKAVSAAGTTNWTWNGGTKKATLSSSPAPVDDIWAVV